MKTKIMGVIAVLAFLLLAFVSYRSKQTVYNEEGVLGNSSGNILNGGLFCEEDDLIYFSNPADEGRLYSMKADLSNVKKLNSDTATNINVAGKYIFYGRHNNQQEQTNENVFAVSNTGLYRVNKNGKNTKTMYDAVVNVIQLCGNTLYFQNNNPTGFGVTQIDIDKSNRMEVSEKPIFPYAITEDSLYYVGVEKDHNIYQRSLKSNETSVLREGNYGFLTTQNGYLYYLDLANAHSLCRMELSGNNPEVLVEEATSTYNLTPDGAYLFYQVDGTEHDGLYRLDLQTKSSAFICSGNFSNIHTTSNYTFFKDFSSGNFRYIANTGNASPKDFSPEKK